MLVFFVFRLCDARVVGSKLGVVSILACSAAFLRGNGSTFLQSAVIAPRHVERCSNRKIEEEEFGCMNKIGETQRREETLGALHIGFSRRAGAKQYWIW